MLIFSCVGIFALIGIFLFKSARWVSKKAKPIEGRHPLLVGSVGLLLAYLCVQVITAVFCFLSINGLETISSEDSQGNSTVRFKEIQSYSLGLTVFILQSLLGAVRLFFPKAIFSSSVHFMMQLVDPRVLEDKIDPLKIKVNYPLFLKKSKSNMFQKALKEDFEKREQIRNSPIKPTSKYQITKKKIKGKKDIKENTANKDGQLLSGGFFSSRGAKPQLNVIEVESYPKNQQLENNIENNYKKNSLVESASSVL